MNNEVNETFSFGSEANNFDYNRISGLGESNYENEDLFNTEVSNDSLQTSETLNQYPNFESFNNYENNEFINQPLEYEQDQIFYTEEVGQVSNHNGEIQNSNGISIHDVNFDQESDQNYQIEALNSTEDQIENTESYGGQNNLEESAEAEETAETTEVFDATNQEESELGSDNLDFTVQEETTLNQNVDDSYLDTSVSFESNMFDDNYSLPVVAPTVEQKIVLGETPISELEKLTHFEEEKIQTTDIKSLFDRVGVNVKEASDIFKKNTEMKEKIDSRFEELKKLQSEVEKSKKSQYDEINSYKEEVLGKLTEKKEEIERRLNKLKEFQSSLEKERQEFEQYRKTEKEEIERVQKEVQEAYDSRREELNHIEDVLRKQKDALDEERSQLSLDRIQYESDKNELANNLLKFNEIVDSFTNGMDKINKE